MRRADLYLDPDAERRTFWECRRRRFNVALLASGFLAAVAFFAVLVAWGIWPPPPDQFRAADFEMLSLLCAPIAYAIAMGLANVCYSAGSYFLGFVEAFLQPRDVEAFRRRAFGVGLAFSVALPWVIPVSVWREFIAVHCNCMSARSPRGERSGHVRSSGVRTRAVLGATATATRATWPPTRRGTARRTHR